ncbi:MAG: hypothetical protein QM757_12830 [Paludibaculum sp.]
MSWRALVRILAGYRDAALVKMVAVRGVQATIVQIIDVPRMVDGGVTAILSMHMRMIAVDLVRRHRSLPSIVTHL